VLQDRAQDAGINLQKELDSAGQMTGDPEQLRRVVINVVGNAIDALADAGTEQPLVRVQMGEDLAGEEIWLRIRDNGPGVPEAERERIFRPFQTSKQAGTGLGLAITRKIIDGHGGAIEVGEGPGGGAEFLITLPKQREGDDSIG